MSGFGKYEHYVTYTTVLCGQTLRGHDVFEYEWSVKELKKVITGNVKVCNRLICTATFSNIVMYGVTKYSMIIHTQNN